MTHLNDEILRLFATGQLNEAQGDEIEAHLAVCEVCTRRLDEIEQHKSDPLFQDMQAAGTSELSGYLTSGGRLGNFRLEKRIGRGGMGEA